MINNVLLVSGVQRSDSVIRVRVCILFQILFPFRLLQGCLLNFILGKEPVALISRGQDIEEKQNFSSAFFEELSLLSLYLESICQHYSLIGRALFRIL